jgi:hypothetical protein
VQVDTKTWLKWLLIAVALLGVFFLYRRFNPSTVSFFPKCPFLSLTGLKCPGCGSQRAMHHLFNFELADAFRQNGLLVISIPYILTGLAFDAVKDRKASFLKYRKRFFGTPAIYVVLVVVVAFWILRNLFQLPF